MYCEYYAPWMTGVTQDTFGNGIRMDCMVHLPNDFVNTFGYKENNVALFIAAEISGNCYDDKG